ncbi:MAG TPA: carbon-nitrogen hydrolase family protein [Gammaproteobacteria bacterium]|nr:carbon-nitrogen hydrolase family protein [Gammaproteobacteria bacterium]
MKVAALQMNSRTGLDRNLAQAEQLLSEAAAAGVELAVLPENFSYLGAQDADRVVAAEAPGDGPAQAFLGEQARRHGMWIVGGTVPIRSGEEGRVFSRSLLLSPQGSVAAQYDKLHLFDVEVPGREAESYRESDTTVPGEHPTVANVPIGRIGMTVCYDLRFPALFHRLSVLGMDILIVPAAFTVPTGRVHWRALLQTRAFESLVYVIAAGQWGEHAQGRQTWGHSAIVSPWGDLLGMLDSGVGVVTAEIDLDRQLELRRKFPVLAHRREF